MARMSSSNVLLSIVLLMALSIMSNEYILSVTASDEYIDPWKCSAKEYDGECCMPGALPLSLGVTQCAPGFYCPFINATDTTIVACPSTPVCQLKRLASGFCPVAQGKHEPLLCPVCIHRNASHYSINTTQQQAHETQLIMCGM
jgi:hypothetical protein